MSNPSITYHSNQGTFLLLLCCVCGTCSSVKVCYLFYKVNTIITLYQPGRKGGGGGHLHMKGRGCSSVSLNYLNYNL